MTYVVTPEDFERVVNREFAFLETERFGRAAIECRGDELRAGFERPDATVELHCDAGCEDLMTMVARPGLGRRLLLETIHALHVGDARYPTGTGGSWRSRDDFGRRVALEAALLRENLDAALRDDTLYEEAGGRV